MQIRIRNNSAIRQKFPNFIILFFDKQYKFLSRKIVPPSNYLKNYDVGRVQPSMPSRANINAAFEISIPSRMYAYKIKLIN
jgi:hypothetical protein